LDLPTVRRILKKTIRMPDILYDFPIRSKAGSAFDLLASPRGLDHWWTQRSSGKTGLGQEYELIFGKDYHWRAKVTKCIPDRAFELTMDKSDPDWEGTRVGFELEESGASVQVRFYHRGWPLANEHYRISNYCWAMYLRIAKRWLENGEEVVYEERLKV
jgi:uncharacterized protein YndB with AHSA1/START domain